MGWETVCLCTGSDVFTLPTALLLAAREGEVMEMT